MTYFKENFCSRTEITCPSFFFSIEICRTFLLISISSKGRGEGVGGVGEGRGKRRERDSRETLPPSEFVSRFHLLRKGRCFFWRTRRRDLFPCDKRTFVEISKDTSHKCPRILLDRFVTRQGYMRF